MLSFKKCLINYRIHRRQVAKLLERWALTKVAGSSPRADKVAVVLPLNKGAKTEGLPCFLSYPSSRIYKQRINWVWPRDRLNNIEYICIGNHVEY